MAFKVALRWNGGQQKQDLPDAVTVAEFMRIAETVTSIPTSNMRVSFGLPPRPLLLDDGPDALLKAQGVKKGDILTIESGPVAPPPPPPLPAPPLPAPPQMEQPEMSTEHVKEVLRDYGFTEAQV